MKKLLLTIFILLAFAGQGWGANWFAITGATDFNAVSGGTTSNVWCNTNDADCVCDGCAFLDLAAIANGDVFAANGATIGIDANIGSGAVQVTLTNKGASYTGQDLAAGTNGGGFTIDAATYPNLVLYTHSIAEVNGCITVSGAMSEGEVIDIHGNMLGGSTSQDYGLSTSHTVGTVRVYGNVTAGSNVSAHGWYNSGNGLIYIEGTVTGGGGHGYYNVGTDCIGTVVGDCVGSPSAAGANGCNHASKTPGYLTITGSIISGGYTMGAAGQIKWSPSAATKYISVIGDGTPALYYLTSNVAGGAHPAVTDVKTGTEYGWDGEAVYTGTYSVSGGGGAWGF